MTVIILFKDPGSFYGARDVVKVFSVAQLEQVEKLLAEDDHKTDGDRQYLSIEVHEVEE